MKKWIALLMTLVMVFSFAACGAAAGGQTVSGTLPEIIDAIYAAADLDAETRDF